MKFSPALKWSIVILLPLTLAWKLTIKADDPGKLRHGITQFLTNQSFDVVEERQDLNAMPILRASKGECQILIMRAAPDGSNRDMIRSLAKKNDRSFIVFRGEVHEDEATWTTLLGYLQSEVLFRLGLASHERAVIAVIAQRECKPELLPWSQLRDY